MKINIFKIEDEKQERFLQSIADKWERRSIANINRSHNNADVVVGFTLYTMIPQNEKPILWNWILTAFGETGITSVPNPKALVLIESCVRQGCC